MKLINKKSIVGFAAVLAFAVVAFVTPSSVFAAECSDGASGGAAAGLDCSRGTNVPVNLFGDNSIFSTIVDVLLFVIGAVSVVMLIWGGIRYTTSAGNSTSVTAAKNTIMYAIIGLIIAFLAYAIIHWVVGAITPAA